VFRRSLIVCCLSLVAFSGCRAQSAPGDAKLDRRIEILVRSQLQVPSEYTVSVGARSKSAFTGYDAVPVTFSLPSKPGAKPTTVEFLLSQDGKTLARLQKFDLTKDPNVAQVENRPVRGDATAKVTIVNFDDLECPYCAKMHQQLFPVTLDRYRGLVKVVYKDDPLVEIHPWAMHAAIDANCLAEQSGKAYWEYVDYVHSHGEEISGVDHDPVKAGAVLDRIAREEGGREGAVPARLEACLKAQDSAPVRASMKEADGLNIDGTPTLFINGERLSGAQPVGEVWAAIDRALAAEDEKPPAAGPTNTPAATSPAKAAPTGN
jgi:protein-disulfide isomerase